jgi:hypothetical protein
VAGIAELICRLEFHSDVRRRAENFSEHKFQKKFDYLRNNSGTHGLVSAPGD